MSAPRTNAAIAERMDEWREKKATQESFSANDIEFCREVSAALRKEPPALPAEVEAVLAELRDPVMRVDTKGRKTMHRRAATMLRRYAQAVAEKDSAKCPCDVHACLATVAEKDAEIARLRAIEERAKSYRALLTPGSYCEISECQVFDDMTVILWEEH